MLSPIATLILVLLTLFGALPVYRRVARESPRGEGSIAMLERLLPWWQGKLFVLVLLGFVATDFIVTITLSAADATAHVLENPFLPPVLEGHQVAVTLFLIAILGAVFLKGFKEAIGIAVALVIAYLSLNAVVVAVSFQHVAGEPERARQLAGGALHPAWQPRHDGRGGPARLPPAGARALRVRDRRGGHAAGQGDPSDTPRHPDGRIRNTQETPHLRRADHEWLPHDHAVSSPPC